MDLTEEELEKISKEIDGEDYVPPSRVFSQIEPSELSKILGITIKSDEINKILTFLAFLSAYTEDSQLNISFNAPSSSGKSYIPLEIAKLFPLEDVIIVGYCSPTAFFHQVGEFNKEKGGYIVDLSRKILIFLDQPHTLLLQHLRPLLSHDKKEILLKITDKNQKGGLRTKNIHLIGYPAVVFCSAGLNMDEQEATRFLLLSPETNQEKIRGAIYEKIKSSADSRTYTSILESNPARKLLIERILAIKDENICEVKIANTELIEKTFLESHNFLKPRHQRDIGRILNLIKTIALLNPWFRESGDNLIVANDQDIKGAFKLWGEVSESQELNLPPYVFELYKEIIVTAYKDKNKDVDPELWQGISKQEILQKHYELRNRHLSEDQLRKQIIPMLLVAGLISEEQDIADKRRILYSPTTQSTISQKSEYSGDNGGVDPMKEKFLDEVEEALKDS